MVAVAARGPVGRRLMAAVCTAVLVAGVGWQLRPAPVNAVVERSDDPEVATAAPSDPTPPRVPERDYLAEVFETFLGRPPTADEVATWAPAVRFGDLSTVSHALSVSDEWAGAQVDVLYRSVLRRDVDPGGRELWVGRMRRGTTVEQVAAALFGSGEYYHRAGSRPELFIDSLYRDIFDRPADPHGLSTGVALLGRGRRRDSVAYTLYRSGEARGSRVTRTYYAVLGRGPDPSGHRYWFHQVNKSSESSLVAALVASGEFYRSATGHELPTRPERGQATGFQPFARAGRVHLHHPAAVVDLVGFHQAGHATAQPLARSPLAVEPTLLWSRGRGTDRRSAADIVVPPNHDIRSPVTGTVVEAGNYRLYCRYDDSRLLIIPDADPSVSVAVLHIAGLKVKTGQRVEAGVSPIAKSARVLPFSSQVDALSPRSPWPHVHIEVNSPPAPSGVPQVC